MFIWYKEIKIAKLDSEDCDFPTFYGKCELLRNIPEDIKKYIDFCIRTWPLIENDNLNDKYYQEEATFVGFIDSSDWWVTEDGGNKIPILVPIFTSDSGVSWRLDYSRE